ncbi:MAG: FkbM family methyltransferase [Actinobacteria bacterium]|nr:FkbM family methyltransferase [Actinomycetota bacterium]
MGKKEDGIFLEIGANDGVSCSNTWGLAVRGWTGYLVEAIPDFAAACVLNHKEHGNVFVHQVAMGELDGEEVTFNIGGQLTTANQELRLEYQNTDWAKSIVTSSQVKLRTQRLDTFIEEQQIQAGFDVLVVDVEGFESRVFSGFTLSKWRPKMLIIELTETHPHLRTNSKSDALLGQMILSAEYEIVYKDCINTVFVRRDIWKKAFES